MQPNPSRQTAARTYHRLAVTLAAGLASLLAAMAQAQTYSVLHSFTGGDGSGPYAGVTFDQQGRIYGTTAYGGANKDGAVYRLAREGDGWVVSPLYSFGSPRSDGSEPFARVVFGPGGLLYGTTTLGGTSNLGTVFSLQPPATACKSALCPWVETILHNFTGDGAYPAFGDLIFDQAGNIYGTAFNGGMGGGIVFELSRSGSGWTENVLWQFTYGSDGAYPTGGVIFDSAGNLYGTTSTGGEGDNGVVYELSPTQSGWTETTLYAFTNTDGPGSGGLIWDTQGNLFGITGSGFQGEGPGIAYELTPRNGTWSFSKLYDFGELPAGPVATATFDSQGNLYGPLPTSVGDQNGEIFRLTPSGNQWLYSPFYPFAGGASGGQPFGAVSFDANGNMYGTTSEGGHNNDGTVWEITP